MTFPQARFLRELTASSCGRIPAVERRGARHGDLHGCLDQQSNRLDLDIRRRRHEHEHESEPEPHRFIRRNLHCGIDCLQQRWFRYAQPSGAGLNDHSNGYFQPECDRPDDPATTIDVRHLHRQLRELVRPDYRNPSEPSEPSELSELSELFGLPNHPDASSSRPG